MCHNAKDSSQISVLKLTMVVRPEVVPQSLPAAIHSRTLSHMTDPNMENDVRPWILSSSIYRTCSFKWVTEYSRVMCKYLCTTLSYGPVRNPINSNEQRLIWSQHCLWMWQPICYPPPHARCFCVDAWCTTSTWIDCHYNLQVRLPHCVIMWCPTRHHTWSLSVMTQTGNT